MSMRKHLDGSRKLVPCEQMDDIYKELGLIGESEGLLDAPRGVRLTKDVEYMERVKINV